MSSAAPPPPSAADASAARASPLPPPPALMGAAAAVAHQPPPPPPPAVSQQLVQPQPPSQSHTLVQHGLSSHSHAQSLHHGAQRLSHHAPPSVSQPLQPMHHTLPSARAAARIAPNPSAPLVGASPPILSGGVEKRRAGKYTHPFGGMRQFAEDRAARSGWDHDCLAISNDEQRRDARSHLAEKISDMYKEEFVRVNKAQGKGRPKANNISAAKKTVRMIAERILLSLEARAQAALYKRLMDNRHECEKELRKLRHLHKLGNENPKLSYDEIRSIARSRLSQQPDAPHSPIPLMGNEGNDAADMESAEADAEIEAMKQAVIEMRADEVAKGYKPKLINDRWVELMTQACRRLVKETYSRQYVPRTKVFGCKHFTRKNRIQMVCCGTFPVCRMCHIQDVSRIHDVRIEPVQTMLCMMCGEVQPKTQRCRKCNECFGSYYCDICGITDDTPGYDLRHCDKCNVCMPGLTFHCDQCKSCVPATPEHSAVCPGTTGGGGGGGGGSGGGGGAPSHVGVGVSGGAGALGSTAGAEGSRGGASAGRGGGGGGSAMGAGTTGGVHHHQVNGLGGGGDALDHNAMDHLTGVDNRSAQLFSGL